MDIKKIPPALLIALGLTACGSDDEDTGVTPCLSPNPTEFSTSGSDTGDDGTMSSSVSMTGQDPTTGEPTTGPCLGMEFTTSGPCLLPLPTTGTDDSGTDTDTDTDGTGTDTDGTGTSGGSSSSSGALDPDADGGAQAQDRGAVLDRILGDSILPADVAQRLRKRLDDQ